MAVEHGGNTYRLVMFDLDDTLAPSRVHCLTRWPAQLRRLLERGLVCIISGGQFGQFDAQVLSRIGDDPNAANLHLMPTCGTQYVRLWRLRLGRRSTPNTCPTTRSTHARCLESGAEELGLWEAQPWVRSWRDRGSLDHLQCARTRRPRRRQGRLGPDGAKRKHCVRMRRNGSPDLEVRSGGSTSVDVTRKGIDKAYGARRPQWREILRPGTSPTSLFCGDRPRRGGNDRPVADLGSPRRRARLA